MGDFADLALEKIFEKMDLKDKVNFSRSHTKCHDLVARKRKMFLAGSIKLSLFTTNILQLREVCSSWNQAIIQELDETPLEDRRPWDPHIGSTRSVPELQNKFHSSESIQTFLEEMDKHPGNPFINRNVQLYHCEKDNDEVHVRNEYWLNATKLLYKFGIYVHILELSALYPVASVEMTRFLSECLRYVPNVKTLYIFAAGGGITGDVYLETIDHKKFFLENPLPMLPNLQELCLRGPRPVFINAVVEACPMPGTLKILILSNVWAYDDWEFPEAVFDFMNLELLKTEMSDIDFQRFTSRFTVPPIKTLEWNFKNKREGVVNPQLIVLAASAFYNTLENIECSATFSDTDRRSPEYFENIYKLPNNVTLHLNSLRLCQEQIRPYRSFFNSVKT